MALKGMRVKARDNKNYGTTRVEFDSAKNRCKIVSQSMLEYIEYMRLEFDPEVISYVPPRLPSLYYVFSDVLNHCL